jgi:hypothetical protein
MNARLKLALLPLMAAFFFVLENEGFAQANLADLLGLTGGNETNEQLAALEIANLNAGLLTINNQSNATGAAAPAGAGGAAGHCPKPTFSHCFVPICCKPVLSCAQRFPCIGGSGGVTINVTNIVINITINIFINFPDPSPAAA